MVKDLDYLAYFQDYYGKGENSDEKNPCRHPFHPLRQPNAPLTPGAAGSTYPTGYHPGASPKMNWLSSLPSSAPRDWNLDYVVIPQCDENLLPYLKGEHTDIYDTKGLVHDNLMSTTLENERRPVLCGSPPALAKGC